MYRLLLVRLSLRACRNLLAASFLIGGAQLHGAEEPLWSKSNEKPLVELPAPLDIAAVNKKPVKFVSLRSIVEGRLPTMLEKAGTFVLPLAKSHRDPEVGRIEINVKSDTMIGLLARWIEGENASAYDEYRSEEDLHEEGWIPIDAILPAHRDVGYYKFFVRTCRAGEKLVLRTRLYYPPFVVAGLPQISLLDLEAPATAPELLQREAVRAKTKFFLRQKRFDDLERMGTGYLERDSMYPSGRYRIRDLRRPFVAKDSAASRTRLEHDIRLLDEWRKHKPDSRVVQLILSGAYVRLAELIEQSHLGDESRGDFLRRSALELLYELEQEGFKHPMLYTAMIELAKSQKWDDELVDVYVDRSIATGKWCADTVAEAYALYDHRYWGEPKTRNARQLDLIKRAVDGTRAKYGEAMYVAFSLDLRKVSGNAEYLFGGFDWKRGPQAFADLQKHFPESELLRRQLFRLACAQADHSLADPLRSRLGNVEMFDRSVWYTEREMRGHLAWCAPDFAKGDQAMLIEHPRSPLRGIGWIDSGTRLLTVDETCLLGELSPEDASKQKWLGTSLIETAACFYCTPDGKSAALGTYFSELIAVNAELQIRRHLVYPREHVFRVCVTADRRRLAAGSHDGFVYLYDLPPIDGIDKDEQSVEFIEPASEFRVGTNNVRHLSFLQNGASLLVCDSTGKIELRNCKDASLIRDWTTPRAQIRSAAVAGDGKTLVTTDAKTVRVFDIDQGIQLREFSRPQRVSNSMAISPDGRLLAIGDGYLEVFEPERIQIFELESGRLIKSLVGHKGCITGVAFSPDGKRLASSSLDMSIRVWEVPQLQ